MILQSEDFMKMTESQEELCFAYDKKRDKLYLSKDTAQLLNSTTIVRSYWKESSLWNRIPQQNQEKLVNLLRQEMDESRSIICQVPIDCGDDFGTRCYQLELKLLLDDDIREEVLGVKGKLIPIS